MASQNDQHSQQTQQVGISSSSLDSAFLLDSPEVAKQMAALTAANQARIAQNTRISSSSLPPPSGTSSGPHLGAINSHSYTSSSSHDLLTSSAGPVNFPISNNLGLPLQTPNSSANNSFLDSSMSQPNSSRNQLFQNAALKQRQHGFLQGLAGLMAKRGTPLPPSLTGIPSMDYDSNNSPFFIIEPSTEVGSFRLANKDVDLFKLWGLVFQNGGGSAVTNSNGWGALLQHFDLPDEFQEAQADGSTSVALMLSNYYMTILSPFEEMYRRNLHDQQKKAQFSHRPMAIQGHQFTSSSLARSSPGTNVQPGRPMNVNGVVSANNPAQYPPAMNQHRTSSQNPHHVSPSDPHNPLISSKSDSLIQSIDPNLLDPEIQGIKRKLEHDERDMKRQKTDPPESNSVLTSVSSENTNIHPESQVHSNFDVSHHPLSRRRIEYIPYIRDVQTYGGRDLQTIDSERQASIPRRQLREIDHWGTIDIDCLCMSIRSHLSIELSYALTTFTFLSTMRGQASGSGFPINNCPDLVDDTLDLLEEIAFGDTTKNPLSSSLDPSSTIVSNRELVSLVQDLQLRPFAPLEKLQGSKRPVLGPQQRPGNIILAIVNIMRNLSIIADNVDFIANHPRLLDILLHLCIITQKDGKVVPLSRAISFSDLLIIRRDTINILMGVAGFINLSNNPPHIALMMARRAYELLASYLIDPIDAVPPLASVQLAGVPPSANRKPPALADIALEVLTRISQLDSNRQVIAKAVPSTTLWTLLTSLVHRLPVVDGDFVMMQREYWLSFHEKIVMAIYSLVFLSPYEFKQKIKSDRSLGFKNVMLRMAQKIFTISNVNFSYSARRAVETLKLLDKSEDLVDNTEPTIPVLSFGMGFADSSDSGMEKGTGMLGGNKIAWEMLMLRDVFQDEVLFNELDSMVRLECQ